MNLTPCPENIRLSIELSGIYSRLLTVVHMVQQNKELSKDHVLNELMELTLKVQESLGEQNLVKREKDPSSDSLAAKDE